MIMGKQKKTSEINIQIDGKGVKATEGMTVLEAAQSADIFIPTLCHHEKLEPHGLCRICTVEVEVRGWTNFVAACLYPVEKDLIVIPLSIGRAHFCTPVTLKNRLPSSA